MLLASAFEALFSLPFAPFILQSENPETRDPKLET
jgi:hypothetical protein